MVSIGFVLVTYNNPEQSIYLSRRLTDLFDGPIALHHDFGQCNLSRSKLPSSVQVVDRWVPTAWGTFPVVEANRLALRLLYENADPEWCVSLSTADYPIKTPSHILSFLETSPFDAFLDHRELRLQGSQEHTRDESKAFHDPAWLEVAYQRYVAVNVNPDRLTWRFPWLHKPRLLRGALAEQLLTPFGSRLRPFGGDAWYTINRKAAEVLLRDDDRFRRLRRHYRPKRVPEESIYQTVLCNEPGLNICGDNLRYTDWSHGGSSPRLLNAHDIPTLIGSSAHFARKFILDEHLFQQIDQATLEVAHR